MINPIHKTANCPSPTNNSSKAAGAQHTKSTSESSTQIKKREKKETNRSYFRLRRRKGKKLKRSLPTYNLTTLTDTQLEKSRNLRQMKEEKGDFPDLRMKKMVVAIEELAK